jgi:hypothetical protein
MTSNGKMFIPSFIEIYQLVEKLLVGGTDGQADVIMPGDYHSFYIKEVNLMCITERTNMSVWIKLHSTRRGVFLLAHWTWN